MVVVGEEIQDGAVGRHDVLRVAAQRHPAEGALALAEERADVRRDEAGEFEGAREAAEARLVADGIAVVEDLGTAVHEADHRLDMLGHRDAGAVGELLGLLRRVVRAISEIDVLGQVAQRIVRTRLVGDDVDLDSAAQQLGEDDRGIAEYADRQGTAFLLRSRDARDRIVEVMRDLVEVAVLDALGQTRGVDIDDEADALVHRHREWLRAAHAAAARGEGEGAGERAAKLLGSDRGEGLVGPLQNPLGADVDPGACGHLAVHREAELLEAAELRPVGPIADEVGVGDEHARRPLVGAEDTDRPARLHEHRLVVGKRGERADHRVEGRPIARRATRAAVDDKLVRVLGDLGVEVVLQHAQCGLLRPTACSKGRAAGRGYGASSGQCVGHVSPPVG